MENSKLEIKNIDMNSIVLQAEKISGLAQVLEIFIESEDEGFLTGAFECLTDLAYEHHKDCKSLSNKLCKADNN